MKYTAMFLWIVLPIAAYAIYSIHGIPHMIWSYRFIDNGNPHNRGSNPIGDRFYTECTFIGPYGGFTVPADNGRCSWVRFFQAGAGQ